MVTWEFGANVVKIGKRKKDEKWLPESWGRRGKERRRGAEIFFFTYTLTYFTGKW